MRRTSSTTVVAAVLTVASLLVFAPGIIAGKSVGDDGSVARLWPYTQVANVLPERANTFLYDATFVFNPDLDWTRDRIRSLTPPIWNPNMGAGYPMLAGQQTAPFYPLNLLAYVLPFWWSLGLILLLKLVLAGVGTFLFARSVGLRRAPAGLAALSYPFGSYSISWLSHPHANVYLLIPWGLLAVDAVIRRPDLRSGALLAAVVGLMLLGGHPENLFICGAFVAAYAAWRGWRRPRRTWAVLGVAGLVGLAAGAVMLFPFLEALRQDTGAPRGDQLAPAASLWTYIVPEWHGRYDLPFNEGGGFSNYLERTAYVGVLPLLLAVAGLAGARRGLGRFLVISTVLSGVLIYEVPGFTKAIIGLPVVDQVYLGRARNVMAFALAILAAMGLQRLLDRDRTAFRLAVGASALGIGIPLIWLFADGTARGGLGDAFGALNLLGNDPHDAGAMHAAALVRWLLFAAAGAALLAVGLKRGRHARVLALAACALVVADLVNLQRGFYPSYDPALFDRPPPAVNAARATLGSGRILTAGEDLRPNQQNVWNLRTVGGHALPEIARNAELFAALGGVGQQLRRNQYLGPWPRLAKAFAVTKIMAQAPPPPAPGVTAAADGLFDFPGPARATVVTAPRFASTEKQALRLVTGGAEDDVVRRPVIEDAEPVAAGRARVTPAEITHDGDLDVDIRVTAPRGGWLVLRDSYYPGWKATVDGKATDIHPADVAFRAVRLPPGARTVSFSYRPASVIAGVIVSVLAWAGILAALGLTALRRRRARRG